MIDQYQVTTDKRSGIISDPNRENELRYIVDLVGRMVQVNVETVRIVTGLPAEYSSSALVIASSERAAIKRELLIMMDWLPQDKQSCPLRGPKDQN